MADEFNVPVTSRQDAFLAGIMKAAQGSESAVPTPVWDYEKRLYDIWKIAQGEEPVYNLPVHTTHPDAFYSAIADAIASGGSSVADDFLWAGGEYF